MKKILFVCNNLNHGGIPRALVNLLREIEGSAEIHLLLFYPAGDYLDQVPDTVKLLPSQGLLPLLGIPQEQLLRQSRGKACLRAFFVIVSRLFGNEWSRNRVFATVPELSGYDVAVAFAQDNSDRAFAIGCNAFVLKKVKAKKKVTFVHCDFENYGGNTPGNRKQYPGFDRIACVSEGCRRAFLRVMPELSERTLVVGNCTDYREILRLGEESIAENGKDFTLGSPTDPNSRQMRLLQKRGESALPVFRMITVARVNPEKGYLRALEAAAPVMEEFPELVWDIVGDGPEMEALKGKVEEKKLTHRIFFYGMQANPYPYVKRADLFFLPSFHEAAPMVFDEARSLGTPVLTTDTLSARDMVEKRDMGWVCENSEEAIRSSLRELLQNRAEWKRVKDRLAEQSLSNEIPRKQWEILVDQ